MPVPPLMEQRAIADILGALDDKIESNRRMSALSRDIRDAEFARLLTVQEWPTRPLATVVDINARKLNPGDPQDAIDYVDISGVEPGVVTESKRITWADAPGRARRGVRDGDVIFSTVRPERRSHALLLEPDPATVVSTGFATLTPAHIGQPF